MLGRHGEILNRRDGSSSIRFIMLPAMLDKNIIADYQDCQSCRIIDIRRCCSSWASGTRPRDTFNSAKWYLDAS